MQRSRHLWHSTIGILLFGLALTACAGGTDTLTVGSSGSSSSTTSSGSSTTMTAATATPTSAPSVARCSDIAAFASAGAASFTTSTFPAISFPASTVGYVADNYEMNGYQYRIINYCTPGNTVAGIRSYFASNFPMHGYSTTPTFPLHGDPHAMCGDPYCWVFQEAGPPFYAGLEFLSGEGVVGSVVTYDIRLIIVPISSGSVLIHDGNSFEFFTGQVVPSGGDITMHGGYQIFCNGTVMAGGGINGTNLNAVTLNQLKGVAYNGNFLNFTVPGSENTSHIFPFKLDGSTWVKVIFGNVSGSPTSLWVNWVTYSATF
jgi:hypothetical protein